MVPRVLVGRPVVIGTQAGGSASASSLRQTPPPAAATHRRPPGRGVPRWGSTASPVTRAEVTESLRLSVTGDGANGTSGPMTCQLGPTAGRAATSGVLERNAERGRRVGRL